MGDGGDPQPFDRLRTGLTFSQDGRREGMGRDALPREILRRGASSEYLC